MDFSKKYDISVYLTEEQLNKRIAEIGAQITEKYRGQSVYLICILKGSIFFTTELAKRIDLPMTQAQSHQAMSRLKRTLSILSRERMSSS